MPRPRPLSGAAASTSMSFDNFMKERRSQSSQSKGRPAGQKIQRNAKKVEKVKVSLRLNGTRNCHDLYVADRPRPGGSCLQFAAPLQAKTLLE